MKKLRILSLGRNNLKRIEKLEEVADTLEELWASYNQIATLDGVVPLTNLTTLYLSNNKIKDWEELAKLVRWAAPCARGVRGAPLTAAPLFAPRRAPCRTSGTSYSWVTLSTRASARRRPASRSSSASRT